MRLIQALGAKVGGSKQKKKSTNGYGKTCVSVDGDDNDVRDICLRGREVVWGWLVVADGCSINGVWFCACVEGVPIKWCDIICTSICSNQPSVMPIKPNLRTLLYLAMNSTELARRL